MTTDCEVAVALLEHKLRNLNEHIQRDGVLVCAGNHKATISYISIMQHLRNIRCSVTESICIVTNINRKPNIKYEIDLHELVSNNHQHVNARALKYCDVLLWQRSLSWTVNNCLYNNVLVPLISSYLSISFPFRKFFKSCLCLFCYLLQFFGLCEHDKQKYDIASVTFS